MSQNEGEPFGSLSLYGILNNNVYIVSDVSYPMKYEQVSVSMPYDLITQVRKIVTDIGYGATVSGFICKAVEIYLKKHAPKK